MTLNEMSDQEFNRLTHDEIMESLPAFVVGALHPYEMLEIEEYIHAHPELIARVLELELTAAKLAYSAPTQPLPKETYTKVMNRVRASLPPAQQPAVAPRNVIPVQPRPTQPPARESGLAAWWRRGGLLSLGLATAVAALLILGIVYFRSLGEIGRLRVQVQGLENQVVTIQQQNSDLQNTNTRLQGELDMRQNQLASIAGAQQAVALAGTKDAPSASGTLYVQGDTGTLVLNNLAALGDDQVYQLWLIPTTGAPIPAGLVGRGNDPVETITIPLPASMDNIAAVGVSVEPPTGSTAPTRPIVLLGQKA